MNLKKIITLCFLLVCVPVAAETSQGIMFLIDDSEPNPQNGDIYSNGTLSRDLAASAQDLYACLLEENTIIITTSSLVHYLMRYLKEVGTNPLDIRQKPTIKPNNWIKIPQNDYIYLLIPKKYAEKRPNYSLWKLADLSKSKYSAEELTLGLKLIKKKQMGDDDFMKAEYHAPATKYKRRIITTHIEEFDASWISEELMRHLYDIFILKEEYFNMFSASIQNQTLMTMIPHTAVILTGHGGYYTSIDQQIATLHSWGNDSEIRQEIARLEQLKKGGKKIYRSGQIGGLYPGDFAYLVYFMSHHLTTTILFVNSCFASGLNIQEALNSLTKFEEQALTPQKINFPIITGASTNAYIYGGASVDSIRDAQGNWTWYMERPNVALFIKSLNDALKITDPVLLNSLPYVYNFYSKGSSFSNIPSVKFLNEPWRFIRIPKTIVNLDEIYTPNIEQFDVSTYFKIASGKSSGQHFYSNVLLLGLEQVPTDLVISGQNNIDLPAVISSVPGDSVHHIRKIDAHCFAFSECIASFFSVSNLHENKIFIIDEYEARNDVDWQSNQGATTFTNLILINSWDSTTKEPPHTEGYFMYQGKAWKAYKADPENPTFICKLDNDQQRIETLLKKYLITPFKKPTKQPPARPKPQEPIDRKAIDDLARALFAL